jgi:hypothetical protein
MDVEGYIIYLVASNTALTFVMWLMWKQLRRHQRAIEWFMNHIKLDERKFEADPPPDELLDMVREED